VVISQLNYSIPDFWFLFSQPGWWFGTLLLFFHSVGNVIIPSDFHIFQRGRYTTSQPTLGSFCHVPSEPLASLHRRQGNIGVPSVTSNACVQGCPGLERCYARNMWQLMSTPD
jgi:hypothetical protein